MVMCWALSCSHYNVRETCQFFSFPKDPEELKKWIANLKRTDEPGPGARICSCHFPEGNRANGPMLSLNKKSNIMDANHQTQPNANEEMEMEESIEITVQTDDECATSVVWEEKLVNENDFETVFLSDAESTENSMISTENASMSLRQTIESIQKGNPQIETVFIDSGSEKDCNETLSIFDDDYDDSTTEDASEIDDFENSIESIDDLKMTAAQFGEMATESLEDLSPVKPDTCRKIDVSSNSTHCKAESVTPSKSPMIHSTNQNIKAKEREKSNMNGNMFLEKSASPDDISNVSSNPSPLKSVDTNQTLTTQQKPNVNLTKNSFRANQNPTPLKAQLTRPPPLLVQKIALKEAPDIIASANILELSVDSAPNSSKKYLVIPNHVLQLFKQIKGSVTINIPELGPVVVQNPADITQAVQNARLKPSEAAIPSHHTVVSQSEALVDPKFRCWKFRKNVKRDLEGYSYYERMGFYRIDITRATQCAHKLNFLVNRLASSIKQSEANLWQLRGDNIKKQKASPPTTGVRSGSRHNNVSALKRLRVEEHLPSQTRVRVDDHSYSRSVMMNSKRRRNIDYNRITDIGEIQKTTRNGQNSIRNQTIENAAATTRLYDDVSTESDLLITKKVVILNDDYGQPNRRKRMGNYINLLRRGLENKHVKLRANPEAKRNEFSTQSLIKRNSFNNEHVSYVKRRPGRPRKLDSQITPIKNKPGRPRVINLERKERKINLSTSDYSSQIQNDVKFKTPCYVELSRGAITKEYLETMERFYNDPRRVKIIKKLKDFQSAIDVSKPILVINRKQWSTINLAESSVTNNITWPISGPGDLPPWIGLAAVTYNIKFVQPDILCKYLSGERENGFS